MSIDSRSRLPELDEYDLNREKFTEEQLAPYVGQWVAFSSDGKRIVAAAADLLELDQRIVAGGEEPEDVWLEAFLQDDLFGAI